MISFDGQFTKNGRTIKVSFICADEAREPIKIVVKNARGFAKMRETIGTDPFHLFGPMINEALDDTRGGLLRRSPTVQTTEIKRDETNSRPARAGRRKRTQPIAASARTVRAAGEPGTRSRRFDSGEPRELGSTIGEAL